MTQNKMLKYQHKYGIQVAVKDIGQ